MAYIYSEFQIKNKITKLKSQITDEKNKISKIESAYDSLVRFKNQVQNAQSDYGAVNNKKISIINSAESLAERMISARRYQEGMNSILTQTNQFGLKNIYSDFLTSISAKLDVYRNDINTRQFRINDYNRQITSLNEELDKLKGGK